jgi:hypothetical protein
MISILCRQESIFFPSEPVANFVIVVGPGLWKNTRAHEDVADSVESRMGDRRARRNASRGTKKIVRHGKGLHEILILSDVAAEYSFAQIQLRIFRDHSDIQWGPLSDLTEATLG